MKKRILIIITFLVGMFTSFSTVKALTNINFSEVSNGEINTTLHFEEGFVGGIDLVLKVNGDISVKNFNFDSKISNNYTKYFNYDENNKTLTIRLTTGGIGTEHNLLNSNKEVSLGKIVLSTSSKENIKYSFSKSSLKIVDNNWDSSMIEEQHLILNEPNEFTFVVNKKDDTSSDNNSNKEDNKENNQENNNDNNVDNINDNSSDNKTNNNANTNTTNNTNTNGNNNDDRLNNDENNNENNNNDSSLNIDKNDTNIQNEREEESRKPNIVIILI